MAFTPFAYQKFNRIKKKLPAPLRREIDPQVGLICENPESGTLKSGDLKGARVHKFTYLGRLYLLAYLVDEPEEAIQLLAIGGHENFYRDLKWYLKG